MQPNPLVKRTFGHRLRSVFVTIGSCVRYQLLRKKELPVSTFKDRPFS
jgi:hypothetical protein